MKDIILIRTSTLRQEIEEQKKETVAFQESFSANEYVVVGGRGASAIKLDEKSNLLKKNLTHAGRRYCVCKPRYLRNSQAYTTLTTCRGGR